MWLLLTRGLKWFGIALALAEIVAPQRTERLTGLGPQSRLRPRFGARELVSSIGRVMARKRTGSHWSRVSAHAADLAAISAALGGRGRRVPMIGLLAALVTMTTLRRKAPRVPAPR